MQEQDYETLKSLALSKLESGKLEHFDVSGMELDEIIENISIFHAELQAQNEELEELLKISSQKSETLNTLFNQAPYPNLLLKDFKTISRTNIEAMKVFDFQTRYDDHGFFLLYIDNAKDKTKFMDWIENSENQIELTLKTVNGAKRHKIFKSKIDNENESFVLLSFIDISYIVEHEKEIQRNYEETIYSLITISEQKDSYTWGHSKRVAFYASKIAQKMGLRQQEIDKIYKIGMLHDIGKIIIPESILLKPGILSDQEMHLMQQHVNSGYDILSPISVYSDIADIVLSHHERYDGSGYPNGLKGEEIPLYAQLIGIADTFDAMTTNRIYKGRKSIDEAIIEIRKLSNIWFEEKLAEVAISVFQKLPEIKSVHQNPQTDMEQFRFSYFFKDQLTGVFNGNFLNVFLQENSETNEYSCLNFIQLQNMSEYNSKYGWTAGDKLLKEFASMLENHINNKMIFRVYGDDFITLNHEHIEIDIDEINEWDILKNGGLSVSNLHYNFKNTSPLTWDELEKTFIKNP